jgi:hypothetical protein
MTHGTDDEVVNAIDIDSDADDVKPESADAELGT